MDTRDAIVVEQARFLHRNTPPAVIGGTFIVLIIVAVFWEVVDETYLLGWAGAVVVLSSFRMWTWNRYRERDFGLTANAWIRMAMTGALLSGCLWGAGALFLIPPGQVA